MNKILFLFLLFICHEGLSQTEDYYIVPFRKELQHQETGGIVRVVKEDVYDKISGIPDSLSYLYEIYSITVDPDILIPGEDDSVGYEYYKKNKVYIYSAVNKEKKEKYVIIDTNTNYDLSDDKLYTFSLEEADTNYGSIPITIETVAYGSENSIPISINLSMDPFDKHDIKKIIYHNQTEDELLLQNVFFRAYSLTAEKLINNYNVNFRVHFLPGTSLIPVDLHTGFRLNFNVPDDPAYYERMMGVRIGDTVSIADRVIFFEKVERNHLYLKDLGMSRDSAGVSKVLPALYGWNPETKEEVHINELIKNKYVLFDFWGSWCKPCIESLPKLVELYNKLEGREDVLIVGLSLDREQDVQQLNTIIKSEDVNWPNFWIKREDSNLPTQAFNKMNVVAFPTYIVVDKTGKIRYRNISSFNVEEVIDFFLALIEEE